MTSPRPPGVASTRGAAIVEVLRSALASLDALDPAEQDAVIGAIVADLQARRPMCAPRRGP